MSEIGDELETRVRDLIVRRLKLEIPPDEIQLEAPLFGEGLGLDSIDALELVVGLEQEFSIEIPDADVGKKVFASVRSIAEYVRQFQEIRRLDSLAPDAYDRMLDPSVPYKLERLLVAVDLEIESDHFGAEHPVERADGNRHISFLFRSQPIYFRVNEVLCHFVSRHAKALRKTGRVLPNV